MSPGLALSWMGLRRMNTMTDEDVEVREMYDNLQYAKVTAANAGTGVITIDRPLKYEFRDDYPVSQGPNPQNGLHCSALLVATDADQNTLYVKGTANLTTNYVPWDIDHNRAKNTLLSPNSDRKRIENTIYLFTGI